MWIIDFGVDMPEGEAALYEAPFQHVLQHVKPMRDKNRRAAYRERWCIHAEPRPAMRRALSGLERFLATPSVAKHRLFVWMNPEVLADHQLFAFARDDDYFMGVLQSRFHETWALRLGTSLEDRPRYTPTSTFETFPFPKATPVLHEAITAAARELDSLRAGWLMPEGATAAELKKRTLTNLYNERPAWLTNAHEALVAAVAAAYRWPADIAEDDALARLLALNLERTPA
jgi:hypothetical protein